MRGLAAALAGVACFVQNQGGIAMLVLTRGKGDSVELSDAVSGRLLGTVAFLEMRGDRARIGFEFGQDVAIWRSELIAPSAPQEDSHVLAET